MKPIMRALVMATAYIELGDDEFIDEDFAVHALESVCAELQVCSKADIQALREVLAEMKHEGFWSNKEMGDEFLETFVENFGIGDEE